MNLIKEITALQEAVDKQWYVTAKVSVAFDDKIGYDRFKDVTVYFVCESEKEAQALMARINHKIISLTSSKGMSKREIVSGWCKKLWPTFAKLTSNVVDFYELKITNKKPGAKMFGIDKTFLK
jgi:hypothetical protein